MKRPKYRCSDCEHWQHGETWQHTFLSTFNVKCEGTCKVSGLPKMNCSYQCYGDFKLKKKTSFIFGGRY